MSEPLRWKNCFADVLTSKYGPMTTSFLRHVIEPSLVVLNEQITAWKASDDPAAAFLVADTEDLLHATTMAFCLSIQALWERQLRTYLAGCARNLRSDETLAKKAMTAHWEELDELFKGLRGISLSEFDQYPDLDYLQVIGNACRHGDGPSLRRLSKMHPELWPRPEIVPSPFLPNEAPPASMSPTIEQMAISRDHLHQFVSAIVAFWDETEYIYCESIERKHPSLEARLVEMRRLRANRIKGS